MIIKEINSLKYDDEIEDQLKKTYLELFQYRHISIQFIVNIN